MFLPGNSGKRVALASMLALSAISGATMIACSSDDASSTPATDGGVRDTSTTSDSGTIADGGNRGDGGPDAGTLYTRLQGHDGIKAAIAAIVGEEVKDPDIASFFAPNLNNPNHAPRVGDIEECLVDLLGQAAGGPETYPTTATSGFVCRPMDVAHAGLHIGNGTFDTFVAIAAAALKARNVSDTDIEAIGAILNGTKSQIVDPAAPDGGPFLGDGDAGDAGGGG